MTAGTLISNNTFIGCNCGGGTCNCSTTSGITYTTTGSSSASYYVQAPGGAIMCDWGGSTVDWDDATKQKISSVIRELEMADGSIIHIDDKGNFRIEDDLAKVIYKASRVRDFNPCINAGDLLAEFIDYVRREVPSVQRKDVPEIPLQVFVNWLILEAASRDGDDAPPDVAPVPKERLLVARVKPQCRLPTCRRFIPRTNGGFLYCNPDHAYEHGRLLKAAQSYQPRGNTPWAWNLNTS